MILKDWDVWLNYSSFFLDEIEDMNALAKSLIKSGLCEVVCDSESNVYWKKGDHIIQKQVEISQIKNKAEISVLFPPGLEGYALEGAFQTTSINFHENHLFSILYLDQFSYLRGFMGACYFTREGKTQILYPQIKVYNNGVFITSYRIISSRSACRLDDFIDNELNMFKCHFDKVDVPPGLMKIGTRSIVLERTGNPFRRIRLWRIVNDTDKAIDTNTKTVDGGDFSFDVCPIGLNEETPGVSRTIRLLDDMISSSLAYILNNRIDGLGYMLRGQKKDNHNKGDFWYGHSTTYILSFVNQPNSSKELVRRYQTDLNRIMARTSSKGLKEPNSFLGKDLRMFDDYSAFIDFGVTLWIYGKKGLKSNIQYSDPNRGHLIYDKQILVESLIYLYMSHIRQMERTFRTSISTEQIIREKQHIMQIEEFIQKISNFGEIVDLLRYAGEKFDFKGLRERIEKNLELRAQSIRQKSTRDFRNFGLLISILFGSFGVFSFSEHILTPLWQYFKLWMPDSLQRLFIDMVALGIVLPIILMTWKIIFMKRQ